MKNINPKTAAKVRLTKYEVQVASLNDSPEKQILLREINKARNELENDDIDYSIAFWKGMKRTIRRLKRRSFFSVGDGKSNIKLVLLGIITYSVIVFFIGICAVIVFSYESTPEPGLIKLVKAIGLDPLFKTVISLGITPHSYLTGLLGGAGAVLSMVRRFDKIAEKKASPWLLFSQGLFNPIVGSLSAVVICMIVSAGLIPEYQGVPIYVLAFFSGFSEKLLSRASSTFSKN